MCVPYNEEIEKMIPELPYKSELSKHPSITKMYQGLNKMFWLPKMKNEVVQYVATCLVCEKPKIEHQKPVGMLQSLDILEWKKGSITMNFLVGLPQIVKKFDSI